MSRKRWDCRHLRTFWRSWPNPDGTPGRSSKSFRFAEGVEKIEDVKPGMKLPGIVTNITAFGAFVDIGVHQDGLVHISELADRFVKNPAEVVKVQQQVMATVLEVDLPRKRISLSLKSSPPRTGAVSQPADTMKKEQQTGRERRPRGTLVNNPFLVAFGKKAT